MENVRFTNRQLCNLKTANGMVEIYKRDGVDCSVCYGLDLIDELRADGGEESIAIAKDLENQVYGEFDLATFEALEQEIGLIEIFGEFIVTKDF